ncbi:DEAD/DEAH box helicase [Bacteroides thetaiotaomicron]|jgi:SWI/SNF-related matrix-associated actin-dependent regulator 1 of chromatin subfamily A|uniref:DEAD/DEAH box helicase n=1 Tax=Bacteroides thetaiotaomicron TaxID=818 RepID=UPI001305F0B5|nr:DEAD/DEAH box helicase [Bacteroides thetaiotaomicron]KAB4492911.1 DEAD/DEAH box helicase [Bacteroides thetaiotaomicron]KAB4501400.1 DEAD/DEAH box helicase [Bacteroides thetaiotaomicron]KAB4504043.1 DEAD/DEAH box helicase [Bacteroides thetaiotaomicron]KAB4513592.1 DEAD/DEAH box helicase [Bacteroides thetaiotaomicron]KAB4517833.1 DEAD/DEAH box helicase [Bacteroides thetaiotaomicron]
MNIELKGDNFELSFKYKPSIIDRIRQIPGRRFDGTRKVWIIPTRSRVDLERMIYQIQQFENINWLSGNEKREEEAVYDIPELPELVIPHNLKIQPYPYQLKGIARGLELKRFMNCDEPGLGKTLQSIATINIAGAFPCLVICPSSLKINWQREWEKFTDKKAMVLTDKVRDTWTFFYQTGMHQVFIVNYESLKKYFVQRIKKAEGWTLRDVEFRNSINLFKSVIIDESHRCKSASTQQAKFCKGICTGKEWVIELTGTPVVNRPKDLIPQLAILNRMDDFGGYKPFVNRYCSGQREASNLKELNFNLWKYCMFRREKSLVLTDLPDKIRQVNTCEITNRKEYMDAERDLIMYLQKYKDADDEKIEKALRGEVMVRINILRQISARGKVRDVIEFVKDFRENGKKIILFCSLHEVVDQLKRYFPTAVSVTGRDSQDEKQRAVDAFQNNPKADIIICSIKAAGVGLTLTASSNVAFVEFPWTYADCCQCEDRAHRIGQKDSVTCYYFLGRRTIDEKVYRIIQEKKNIANAVTGSTEDIEENIVDMVARIFDTDYDDE